MSHELVPHLFRTEYSKIVAVIGKFLGLEHLEIAEDIASETFIAALETWPYKGIPENSTAWLYAVAKNKAKNYLTRHHHYTEKIAHKIKSTATQSPEINLDLSDQIIKDSQLQMLFAVCHPVIAPEAQISLALRFLGGFGIEEIANAFLTNKEVINKRLFRAKEKLREAKIQIELPPEAEIDNRLETVLTTLYLFYNEGYYSESRDVVLREDLCLEAMRLTYLLLQNEKTNQPAVNALLSLMCFHASRFPARKDNNGEIILYQEQDETLWNKELISKGIYFLRQAAQGNKISKYHLEASIAYWHTIKADTPEKWESILQLYNQLLLLEYSPIAALNRTYALAKANNKQEALIQAEKLQLTHNPYYYTLLGELYLDIDTAKAKIYYERAYTLAKTQTDKQTIQKKLNKLAFK
ncbi:RNA polymerase sigma factor [Adhaeribacter arboris]|nr:sigma-70 family RNA polymerase sigma factor [Adhaeribacter arboris]